MHGTRSASNQSQRNKSTSLEKDKGKNQQETKNKLSDKKASDETHKPASR